MHFYVCTFKFKDTHVDKEIVKVCTIVSMPFVSFPYLQLFSKEQLTLCTLHMNKVSGKGKKSSGRLGNE